MKTWAARIVLLLTVGAMLLVPFIMRDKSGVSFKENVVVKARGAHGNVISHSERVHLKDPSKKVSTSDFPAQAWCGTETTKDLTVNAVDDTNPKFKIYYAYASDQPDNFQQWAPELQRTAAQTSEAVRIASGGVKGIRFDRGTSCGPEYLDIQVIKLPKTLSVYQADWNGDTYIKDLNAAIGTNSFPVRHQVFYLDGFGGYSISGLGDAPVDHANNWSNASNAPNYQAWVSGPQGSPANNVGYTNYYLALVMLHEITHTMGAVSNKSQHATGASHCIDGNDVMCYNDGGPRGSLFSKVCESDPSSPIPDQYDCNKDDYFNPNPPAGSFLTTHWNVYNSNFLTKCLDVKQSCPIYPRPAFSEKILTPIKAKGKVIGNLAFIRGMAARSSSKFVYYGELEGVKNSYKKNKRITYCLTFSKKVKKICGTRKSIMTKPMKGKNKVYVRMQVTIKSKTGKTIAKSNRSKPFPFFYTK